MTPHSAVVVVVALAGAGCVTLQDIQSTPALMRLQFAGPYTPVAECIQRRVGGRMQQAPSARAYVVYDTAKADHSLGLTHYAITVGENGPDSGFAEWRVLAVPSGSRGRAQTGWATLTPEAFTKYWQPVQECAAKRQD